MVRVKKQGVSQSLLVFFVIYTGILKLAPSKQINCHNITINLNFCFFCIIIIQPY